MSSGDGAAMLAGLHHLSPSERRAFDLLASRLDQWWDYPLFRRMLWGKRKARFYHPTTAYMLTMRLRRKLVGSEWRIERGTAQGTFRLVHAVTDDAPAGQKG